MSGMSNHTGTCTKCGRRCHYVTYPLHNPTRGYWVHETTDNFMSDEPERHDANTYIERDKS